MTLDTAAQADTDHVIVCGLGNVGYRTVRLLMRLGQRGVVVTTQLNEDWGRAVESHFRVIVGDGRDDRMLQQAGIDRAKALIAVTNDDLANLSIALDARRLNPRVLLVVRQFDQDLAVHLEQSAGIDRVLSASALAAPSFLAAALGTSVQCSFAVGDATCRVSEQTIPAESPWDGALLGQWSAGTGLAPLVLNRAGHVVSPCTANERLASGDHIIALGLADEASESRRRRPVRHGPRLSALRRVGLWARLWWREIPQALRIALLALLLVVLVSVGVFRACLGLSLIDSLYFVVTTITTVGYGDYHLLTAPALLKLYGAFLMLCGAALLAIIFSITTDFVLRTRLRDLMAYGSAHQQGHVIVAGLGKIGLRLVRDLVQAGHNVVAIEHRSEAPHLQAVRELVPVVLGNAKNEETLRKAGATGAKVLVAATDDDLANLSTALLAKRLQPACRVVLRVFNSELAEKLQRSLPMDAVLSVSAAAVPTFVGAALCPHTLYGFVLGDRLLAIFRQKLAPEAAQDQPASGAAVPDHRILFVKRAGTGRYDPAGAEPPGPDDEVLGVRWYPLDAIG